MHDRLTQGSGFAYAHLVGSEWKPYEAQNQTPTVSRSSATAQMGAFGD